MIPNASVVHGFTVPEAVIERVPVEPLAAIASSAEPNENVRLSERSVMVPVVYDTPLGVAP